jgi:hypothetical protein
MATTTNYSWTTPDDTALVKDGASAIRSLGTAIDTTTKNLNPSTTLGDIEYRSSSANTNTRLGIGSSGQVLTVSGGVPAWATPTSGSMTLLSTTALSGTTVTISSINQTYNSLMIFLLNPTWGTGTAQLWLRAQSSSDMEGSGGAMWSSGASSAVSAISGTNINVTATGNSNSAGKVSALWTINNYASTTAFKPFSISSGDDARGSFQGGVIATNTAISSIELANQFGYTFNGGSIVIYGVK